MPTDTTNYGLVKPATTENADISVINGNMDVIDSQMKANADAAAAAQAPGAATDTVIGNRTIDDTIVAAAGADTPTRLWSKLANMIKGITGAVDWHTLPSMTISAIITALGLKAPLASPALTGTPTAPTAAADTNTTQLATTAFVVGQAAGTAPAMDGAAAVGTSKKYARADHVHPTDTSRLAASAYTAADVLAKLKTVDGAGSGADADKLDGVEGTNYLSSTSHTNTNSGADLNAFITNGFFRVSDGLNGPAALGADNDMWLLVQALSDAETYTRQTVWDVRSNHMYVRGRRAGTWDGWKEIYNAGTGGAGSGLDADLLDGIDSVRMIFGDNLRGTIYFNGPADDITKAGFYWIDPDFVSSLPTNTQGYVLHQSFTNTTANDHCMQIHSPYTADRLFYRRKYNGTWQPWLEIWHAGNLANPAKTDAANTFTQNQVIQNAFPALDLIDTDNSTTFTRTIHDGSAYFAQVRNRSDGSWVRDLFKFTLDGQTQLVNNQQLNHAGNTPNATVIPFFLPSMIGTTSSTTYTSQFSILQANGGMGAQDSKNYRFVWDAGLVVGRVVHLEVALKVSANSATAYAALMKVSDSSIIGEITTTVNTGSAPRLRSGALLLQSGQEYCLVLKISDSGTSCNCYAARLIIE